MVFANKIFAMWILTQLLTLNLLSTPNLFVTPSVIENIDVELKFDPDNAYNYVDDQVDIGDRHPGTQEREECANYFIAKFKDIDSDFACYLHNFTTHSTKCQNVLFKLNEKKENIVILAAHYDSRAKATKDSSHSSDPVPAANDGGSGCAVLIELASVLYDRKNDLDCQIWFLFFDAEDQGNDGQGYGMSGWSFCEGSDYFVSDLHDFYDSDEEKFDCMILLDMVGGEALKFINEQYSTSSLLDELFEVGRLLGFTEEFPTFPISASVIDDHRAFVDKGIPSVDLIINFWDNPDWPYHHTTDDDMSHISKSSLEATGKTVEQFIYNNYLKDSSDNYEGNSPWNIDINLPDTEVVIVLVIIGIIGVTVVLLYLIRLKALKKVKIEESTTSKKTDTTLKNNTRK